MLQKKKGKEVKTSAISSTVHQRL